MYSSVIFKAQRNQLTNWIQVIFRDVINELINEWMKGALQMYVPAYKLIHPSINMSITVFFLEISLVLIFILN
jgi:hypothetical protein